MITSKHLLLGVIGLLAWWGCADNGDRLPSVAGATLSGTPVRYHYDALGRLIHAGSPEGASVQYRYDAVGNITAISRPASNTLSVTGFAPRSGTPGDNVTVFGVGFEPTPMGNTVTFNGTAAAVMSATDTALTVEVPTPVTSGKIAVGNPKGEATSESDFLILTTESPSPSILEFTPNIGTQGTQVTVTGSNFQLNAADDKLTIGGQPATVDSDGASPTATRLTFRVPSTTASGHLRLTTPFGTAVSKTEFFALPSTINPADVEITARLVVNGPPLSITATATSKKAVLLFDAESGQVPRFVTQGGTPMERTKADVYGPDGIKIRTINLSRDDPNGFPTALTFTGTHMLVVSPEGATRLDLKLSIAVDAVGQLTVNGNTPITLLPGQNAHFSFTGEAGKGYGLALTGLTFVPTSGTNRVVAVTLRKADGTILSQPSQFSQDSSRDFVTTNFATSGTYLIDFDPGGINAVAFNAIFSKDSGGPIAVPASTNVSIARSGQNARFTFAGTQGQSAQVVLAGTLDDSDPISRNGTAMIVFRPSNPNSGPVAFGTLSQRDEEFGRKLTFNMSLPETGDYTILINPSNLLFGTLRLTLN